MKPVSVSSVALISAIATSVAADASHFEPTTLNAPFLEQFNDSWESRWSPSHAVKQTPVNAEKETFSYVGQWSVEEPTVFPGIPGDKGLVIKSKAAHHAISAPIQPAVRIEEGKPLVVQYETKLQKGLECGGAYMKLLSEGQGDIGSAEFSDKTPFTIMFGPDKCGSTNKVHFIFRHANPMTGEYEEKHLTATPSPKITKTTALYTLIINPDNTFEILINDESVKTGSLLEDFEPPVNPAKEIDDPNDFKPADWVDEAKIQDPEATKPADWNEDAPAMIVDEEATIPEGWLSNEPEVIPDPDAEKPEEWDDEEDGDWIAPSVSNPLCEEAPGCGPWSQPLIPNPSYRGKWSAPLIDNPSYKGIWAPQRIANPAYFEDLEPAKSLTPIGGVGFEIWTMTEDMLFDNVYIGHSPSDAKALAQETFHTKSALEKEAEKAFLGDEDENDSLDGSKGKNGPFYEPYFSQAQEKVREFVEEMNEGNIKDAVMNHPMTAGMLGAALLTFLGFLSTIMSLLSGGGLPPAQSTPPKPVKSTKPTTTTTTVVTEEKLVRLPDEVAADQSSAPVLLAPEVELESTGVRERVSKGKGREQL